MILDVAIKGNELEVSCFIHFPPSPLSFSLADSMSVTKIGDGMHIVEYAVTGSAQMPFRPAMKTYIVPEIRSDTLEIQYHGSLNGIWGYLRDDLIHFSMYNGWYPTNIGTEQSYHIKVHLDDRWNMIHGVYAPAEQIWEYTADERTQSIKDCNILLLKRTFYRTLENKMVRISYLPEYEDEIRECFQQYSDICRYYAELYGVNKVGKTDIVFLGVQERLGAYYRDGLIVFSSTPMYIEEAIHGLAHEAGHAYGQGANTETWEDWLNETTAEWSALIYEAENDPDAFQRNIYQCQAQALGHPCLLRPNGDARPENVHEIGTLIYYKIYQSFGAQAIKALLRTFDALEEKNTERFLTALRNNGSESLAHVLSAYI